MPKKKLKTYGTMHEKSSAKEAAIPMHSSSAEADKDNALYDLLGFNQSPGNEFWDQVTELFDDGRKGITWETAINTTRVNIIVKDCSERTPALDPVLYLMEHAYNHFLKCHSQDKELLPSFKRDLSKLVIILLDRADKEAEENDDDSKYSVLVDPHDSHVRRSLLHIASQNNLIDIAKELVKRYDLLLNVKTQSDDQDHDGFLPVEFALINSYDEMASMLIDEMPNGSVRDLFAWQDNIQGEWRAYKFKDYIENETMMKTVASILDCFIDPSWPYLPSSSEDDMIPQAWRKIPDIPLRYHFYYKILDGDHNGKDPTSPSFNRHDLSPLHMLVMSSHIKECIRHPVVRMLVRAKWDAFARRLIWAYSVSYVLFLLALSIALLLGATHSQENRLDYSSPVDYMRLACEVIVVAMTLFYLLAEINQFSTERKTYWRDIFNYMDILGLLGTIAIIPLRLVDSNAQWTVASLAFMVNFMRIFKFSYAWEQGGLYANTLVNIITKDIPKFCAVYVVIVLAFTGGLFLALTGTGNVAMAGGYKGILVKEIRALVETNGFSDNYDNYNAFLTTIILVNMFAIIVLMFNVLIAQLSYRYDEAQKEASMQFDIDKALMVTRVENSRIRFLNLREKYYQEGAYVNDTSVVKDILADWNAVTQGADNERQEKALSEILTAITTLKQLLQHSSK